MDRPLWFRTETTRDEHQLKKSHDSIAYALCQRVLPMSMHKPTGVLLATVLLAACSAFPSVDDEDSAVGDAHPDLGGYNAALSSSLIPSALRKAAVDDVYVHPINKQSAILKRPALQSFQFSSAPAIDLTLPWYSISINSLTGDPNGGSWGSKLLIYSSNASRMHVVEPPVGSWIGHVAWSPDGRWVSYLIRDQHFNSLWAVSTQNGRQIQLSTEPLNVAVVGQETYSVFRLHKEHVPYTWLADSSAIAYVARHDVGKLDTEDWYQIRVPKVSDSTNPAKGWDAPAYYGDKRLKAVRSTLLQRVFSSRLVVASLDRRSKTRFFDSDALITHLVSHAMSNRTSFLTVSIDEDGAFVRDGHEVDVGGGRIRLSRSATVPVSAYLEPIAPINEDDIAIVRLRENEEECFHVLSESTTPLCFQDDVLDVVDSGSRFFVLESNYSVSQVSKEGLTPDGSVHVPSKNAVRPYLLGALGARCPSPVSPLVAFETFPNDASSGGPASVEPPIHQVINLDFTGKNRQQLSEFGDNSTKIKPSRAMLCDGRPILSRESWLSPRAVYVSDLTSRETTRLYDSSDVMRDFVDWVRLDLAFVRTDGVALRADVIIPPNKNKERDGQYPAIVWQYPTHFSSLEDWHQRKDKSSPRFGLRKDNPKNEHRRPLTEVYIGNWLPYLLAYEGYAVIAYPDFPLIGIDGNNEYGTFAHQRVLNARALFESLLQTGYIDRKRIAIGGHSRGGTDAALLLAETNMFAAGFSFASASNFGNTPNSFQFESRPFHNSPDVYIRNSSILNVNSIDEPLLILHGEEDNFPKDEDSLFLHHALNRAGMTSRVVVYPGESHIPLYRETQAHVLREVIDWLDKHVSTN